MRALANISMKPELHEKLAFGKVDDTRTFLELLLDVYPPSTPDSLFFASLTLSKLSTGPSPAKVLNSMLFELDVVAGLVDLLTQKDKEIIGVLVPVIDALLSFNGP
jgi:hypothetical protein